MNKKTCVLIFTLAIFLFVSTGNLFAERSEGYDEAVHAFSLVMQVYFGVVLKQAFSSEEIPGVKSVEDGNVSLKKLRIDDAGSLNIIGEGDYTYISGTIEADGVSGKIKLKGGPVKKLSWVIEDDGRFKIKANKKTYYADDEIMNSFGF